jgi:hypothetical protein
MQKGQENAPDIENVRKAVLAICKNKKLVGYHILQKLKEMKIDHLITRTLSDGSDAIIDVSGLFDNNNTVKVPMDTLCEKFLGLKYKKSRNLPYAFSECKITMALYQKWREINGEVEKSVEDGVKEVNNEPI